MRNLLSKSLRLLDDNLGRCPRCMKIAFVCAFSSWPAALAAQAFWPGAAVISFVFLAAVGLTALWLLHFASYTARVLAALWSEYRSDSVPMGNDSLGVGRRDLLWVCTSALGLGVLATVWLPSPAFAAGRPCGKGHCPDSAPNCCSRAKGKCCDGNWACTKTGTCHASHSDARAKCGKNGIVWACS